MITAPLTHAAAWRGGPKLRPQAEFEADLRILVEQGDFFWCERSVYRHISNALRPERHSGDRQMDRPPSTGVLTSQGAVPAGAGHRPPSSCSIWHLAALRQKALGWRGDGVSYL